MIQEIYDKQKVYEMGLDAISYQDKEKLIQALKEGFTLSGFFRTKTNNQMNNDLKRSYYYSEEHKNLLPFLNIITSGWIEGWKLLVEHFEEDIFVQSDMVTDFPALWEVAAQYAEKEVLEDLVKLGCDPLFRNSEGQNTVHLVYDAIKKDAIVSIPTYKIIETLDWCKSKGMDIYETYPGSQFVDYDINRIGHSIWSYAIRQNSWEIADHYFPTSWFDIIKSKRWKYTLSQLKDLIEIKKLSDKKMFFRSKEYNGTYILNIWNTILNDFLEPYLAFSDDDFSSENDYVYVLDMNKEQREAIWEKYKEININNRNSWFDVIVNIDNPTAYKIIYLAYEDGENIFEILSIPDNLNESPLFLWAANIQSLEIPHSIERTMEHIKFLNFFNEEQKNSIDEYSGFSPKQTVYNTIKDWGKYDKQYKSLLNLIK